MLAEGYVNKEIADRLGLSAPTVATYIRRIYEKLHVHSRAAAIGKFSTLVRAKGTGIAKRASLHPKQRAAHRPSPSKLSIGQFQHGE